MSQGLGHHAKLGGDCPPLCGAGLDTVLVESLDGRRRGGQSDLKEVPVSDTVESLPDGRRDDDTYTTTMVSSAWTTLVATLADASTTRAEIRGQTVTSATDMVRGADKTEGRGSS